MSSEKTFHTVLVSPLDWGLGHATRCIPIIKSLIDNNLRVIVAASGPSAVLLKEEFPACVHLTAPAARFSYSRSRWMFALAVIAQIPKLHRLAKREAAWLKEVVIKYEVDLVISDNRFGMYHQSVPSVFISHQLGLKTGFGSFVDKVVQRKKFRIINCFTECWVPDFKGDEAIAGDLSNAAQLPKIPVHFIGPLSRLQKQNPTETGRILVMLSGPEPQRSILEKIVNTQLEKVEDKIVFVRGLPDNAAPLKKSPLVSYYEHLPASRLCEEVNKAEFVICRSGYSSVMDLLKLKKKGIYIPTPGQPEQEYLGQRLALLKQGLVVRQKDFELSEALRLARNFNYSLPDKDGIPGFMNRVEFLLKGYR